MAYRRPAYPPGLDREVPHPGRTRHGHVAPAARRGQQRRVQHLTGHAHPERVRVLTRVDPLDHVLADALGVTVGTRRAAGQDRLQQAECGPGEVARPVPGGLLRPERGGSRGVQDEDPLGVRRERPGGGRPGDPAADHDDLPVTGDHPGADPTRWCSARASDGVTRHAPVSHPGPATRELKRSGDCVRRPAVLWCGSCAAAEARSTTVVARGLAQRWVPWVREADVILVAGGDAAYLCHSGAAVRAGGPPAVTAGHRLGGAECGSMVLTPRIGADFVAWQSAPRRPHTGVVDFSIFPHLGL